tara:strand:- start:358 stop:1584 length:1227 start_codon:yes stop_codon:yes gene_type:complete
MIPWISIWLFVLVGSCYAESSRNLSNVRSSSVATENDLIGAKNHYQKIHALIEKKPGFKNVELLLNELRTLRSDCLAGHKISVKKLSEFTQRLGSFYDPLQIKLFDDLYNLCFELHLKKQYKPCWWLLQRVQKIYLNKHNTEQLKALDFLRIGLQDLAMLAVKMLESSIWNQFISDAKRRSRLIEEKISDALSLGCGIASLRLARKSFKGNNFEFMAKYVHEALVRLKGDADYLLRYIESNQDRLNTSHNIFVYLRSLIHGIQEVRDLIELLDKAIFSKYFSEYSSATAKQYSVHIDVQAKQRLKLLQNFVSDDFVQAYQTPINEVAQLCIQSMQNILRGLQLHNIDSGIWLELDAVEDFEKTYNELKFLARKQYIESISRKSMRNCFFKLEFKHPTLRTDYESLSIN